MARSNQKRIVIAVSGFLLAFATGVAIALLKGWVRWPTTAAFYESNVIENSKQSFISRVNDLKTSESLDFIQFLNAHVGWAGNHKGALYWTKDGGEQWEPMQSKLEGYVGSIWFSSDLSGWAISQRYGHNSEKIEQEASVLHTDDGGRSWQVQFSAKSIELVRMSFASENEGWVIGTRFFKERDALRSEVILLHSTDAGTNWTDMSRQLNKSMADFWGRVVESPSDIVATGHGAAKVLTENGWIITTVDGGARWENSGRSPVQGLDAQRLIPATAQEFPRVVARTAGNHGTISLVARRESDGRWSSKVVDGVFLKDALYVANGELLACGSMLSANNQPPDGSGEGVVLRSTDDGLNWTIVYRNPSVRSLNALSHSDARHIWAVGSNGSVVDLERGH
jgi:photosystem II stability/assembly factor-like uncharacterized protein